MSKPIKPKKCKQCKALFTPMKPLQSVCGFQCAIDSVNKQKSKALNQDIRRRKLALKTRQEWLKDAQRYFNIYIRLRDEALPCISCGRFHGGQHHAGHYRTVGSSPALRFDESNCHKQCAPCNNHLSGNIVNYRLSLIKKIGIEKVEWLEGPHEPKHYTIEEIQQIKILYKEKTKELTLINDMIKRWQDILALATHPVSAYKLSDNLGLGGQYGIRDSCNALVAIGYLKKVHDINSQNREVVLYQTLKPVYDVANFDADIILVRANREKLKEDEKAEVLAPNHRRYSCDDNHTRLHHPDYLPKSPRVHISGAQTYA